MKQEKGSKKWIRQLVNKRQEVLNKEIIKQLPSGNNQSIKWLSPLVEEGYKEYRDNPFLKKLGIQDKIKEPLKSFWPAGGPRWDALGKSEEFCFLVEAKAHLGEIFDQQGTRAIDPKSLTLIKATRSKLKNELNIKASEGWPFRFYQYINRLAHLDFLQKNRINAFLVLVYFIGDSDFKDAPKAEDEWKSALYVQKRVLGVSNISLNKFVREIFIDTKKID